MIAPSDDRLAETASAAQNPKRGRLVLVTGRSGAGRTTAMSALEDAGYETVDTPPLSFIPAIATQAAAEPSCRLAIGVDSRTRGFSPTAFAAMLSELDAHSEPGSGDAQRGLDLTILFLDCDDETIRRRYTETRRRHPLAPTGSIDEGVARDRAEMLPLRAYATLVIDTSRSKTADFKRDLQARFAADDAPGLAITVESFSYRHGLPPEADLVFDCRFLRNPHYVEHLRAQDGRDRAVAAYVEEDPLYPSFLKQLELFAETLLPAFRAEGKSYLTIAFGCTGGQHRSVAVAEAFARHLSASGWSVNIRHRERKARRKEDAA